MRLPIPRAGKIAPLPVRGPGRAMALSLILGLTPGPPAGAMQDIELRPLSPDWRLITDRVMGGVSQATVTRAILDGRDCTRLSGAVSTENRGGFVQIATDVDAAIAADAAAWTGLALDVRGNGEGYKLHLRTSDLWLPWQSYRADFATSGDWQTVRLPFSAFAPYRVVGRLRVDRLRRIGVVAIGREFDADLCVAGLSLYRQR
jgi:hypothetical protein